MANVWCIRLLLRGQHVFVIPSLLRHLGVSIDALKNYVPVLKTGADMSVTTRTSGWGNFTHEVKMRKRVADRRQREAFTLQ